MPIVFGHWNNSKWMPRQLVPVRGTEVGNYCMRNDISVRQFKYSTSCFVFADFASTSLPRLRVFGYGIADGADSYCWGTDLILQSRAENITESRVKCYWVKRRKTPRFASRLSNILDPTRQYLGHACGQPEPHVRLTKAMRALDSGYTSRWPDIADRSVGICWLFAQCILNTVYQPYNWCMIDVCQSGVKNKK